MENGEILLASVGVYPKLMSVFNAGSRNKIDSAAKKEQMRGFTVSKRSDWNGMCPKDKHKAVTNTGFIQMKATTSNKAFITWASLQNKYKSIQKPDENEENENENN